jgi:antitoxin CptB
MTETSAAHQSDPANRARLRWRARRGLLENDIILTRFLDAHETELTDEEVDADAAAGSVGQCPDGSGTGP